MSSLYRISEVRDRNIDELIGISRGLTADNRVNTKEAEFLRDWILEHFRYDDLDSYPLNTIFDRLEEMLSDDIIDAEEEIELISMLKSLTGDKTITDQVSSMSSTLPLCNPMPEVVLSGSTFCLTGEFTIGTRKTCENLIKELGGTVKKTPTLKTDYLVIGILGSEDWIHSSFGRKIESAVELRDTRKTNMKIITEEHFIKYIGN